MVVLFYVKKYDSEGITKAALMKVDLLKGEKSLQPRPVPPKGAFAQSLLQFPSAPTCVNRLALMLGNLLLL